MKPRPALLLASLSLLSALSGCIDTTGGDRIGFTAVLDAVAPASDSPDGRAIAYEDPDGWQITLTEARLVVGPVYLWSGKPLLQGNLRDNDNQFDYGYLRGEMVSQRAVDLIASAGGSTEVGAGDGLAGEALSGELWLAPPADHLADATFEVAGVAERDGARLTFSGALTIDDSVVDEAAGDIAFERRKVRGIPLDASIAEAGTLHIGCDVRRWLRGADFAALVDPPLAAGETGVAAIAFPGTVWQRWLYQVRQSGSVGPWTLSWDPAQ